MAEVYIRLGKKTFYLWRAVDEDGMVLDILVQERRNQEAAERFLRRVVEREPGEPALVVTGRLAGYLCPTGYGAQLDNGSGRLPVHYFG